VAIIQQTVGFLQLIFSPPLAQTASYATAHYLLQLEGHVS